jgi:thiol:disulfide interchange protein
MQSPVSRAALLLVAAAALAAAAASPIYPDVSAAGPDLEAALKSAAATQRRVIVDFGGNWCGDCKVLDANLRQPENAALLERHFVLVHVNVGDKGIEGNFDLAERFGIPLKKGVPALAVLDPDGRVVYAQRNGEFESMRRMDPKSVNDFLDRWKR